MENLELPVFKEVSNEVELSLNIPSKLSPLLTSSVEEDAPLTIEEFLRICLLENNHISEDKLKGLIEKIGKYKIQDKIRIYNLQNEYVCWVGLSIRYSYELEYTPKALRIMIYDEENEESPTQSIYHIGSN